MVNIAKENLCINKLISEKKDILMIEGDMIVPDSKPDILKTICTSGVACIYKKEVQEEKVRIDGNIATYIMYLPEGGEENVRGLNTSLDFSETISVPNCKPDMEVMLFTEVKSIECKVINGRKIGIKASMEVNLKVYAKDEVEVINDIMDNDNIQMLKEDLKVNSLIGTGETKIYGKDTVQIDAIDNLAEILKVSLSLGEKDIKVSYNKVLAKAETEIKILYLTEDNRIGHSTCKIPIVGFIDIPNVTEENTCDVNYEIKNVVIKPNSQEEHSIYVEIEVGVECQVYEEKQINLIQDLYSPGKKMSFEKKQVMTMSEKQKKCDTKQIREKVNLKEIDGKNLVDVDVMPIIHKENKINSKILYEGEVKLSFLFANATLQMEKREANIPFEYVIDGLQNGETLNSDTEIEIGNQDFVIQDGGDVTCNIDLEMNTNLYRAANMNIMDSIEEEEEGEEQDYSIIIYIVKKGDTLWKIAKKFGSTVDAIVRTNGIKNEDLIMPGQKLFIPRFVKMPKSHYV